VWHFELASIKPIKLTYNPSQPDGQLG